MLPRSELQNNNSPLLSDTSLRDMLMSPRMSKKRAWILLLLFLIVFVFPFIFS